MNAILPIGRGKGIQNWNIYIRPIGIRCERDSVAVLVKRHLLAVGEAQNLEWGWKTFRTRLYGEKKFTSFRETAPIAM